MNLAIYNSLTPEQQKIVLDTSREAQTMVRAATESIDTEANARAALEPHGMTINVPNREPFEKLAREKVWPTYQKMYPELWELITSAKV
jgi:TRAP-type C4-dicarboxylate transport system substrate-binding protein